MHINLNVFEIRSGPITDYEVGVEKSMYNVVSTLAPSILIGSFSFLQVTRTAIKSLMGLKFSKIGRDLRSKMLLNVWKNAH